MKTLHLIAACLLGITLAKTSHATSPPVNSPETIAQRADENRSQRLLAKAVQRVRDMGDSALVEFNRSADYIDKELYVYVVGTDGKMLASGGPSSALVGRDIKPLQDAAGKAFIKEMIDAALHAEAGRVEYRWLNPVDNRVEPKVALFQKVGDRIVVVGYYAPRASAEQAKSLLDKASAEVAKGGRAALTAFNSLDGGFTRDDLYVFVVDVETQRFLAHGVSPALVGTDGRLLRDPKGKAIILDMLNIASRKGEGEIEYVWRNPLTEKLESKRTFFRTVNGMLVAVGHYTR
jgi:cytochrome c